jgi:hypothetical protein
VFADGRVMSDIVETSEITCPPIQAQALDNPTAKK